MNLGDLRYLVALSEHHHFGHAADASGVSQPTLSVQIRKLEQELGVALVERTSRRVLLTETGTEIVAYARAILNDVEEIRHIAQSHCDPEAGTLRLGIIPTLGPYLLPHVLARVHKRFPHLELLLTEEKTFELLRLLHAGALDTVLVALPLREEALHAEFLFAEPFVLATPEGHPLARRSSVTLADLKGERLLLLEDGHCLRDQALEVCQMAGATERRGFRGTSLETLRQMVAAEVGSTLMPLLAVEPPIPPTDGVHLTPFRGRVPSRRIGMVWRKGSARRTLLTELSRILKDFCTGLVPASARPRAAARGQRVVGEKRLRRSRV